MVSFKMAGALVGALGLSLAGAGLSPAWSGVHRSSKSKGPARAVLSTVIRPSGSSPASWAIVVALAVIMPGPIDTPQFNLLAS